MGLLSKSRSTYPRDSAGIYIEEFVPTASPDDTASGVIQKIVEATKEWDSLTYIYVLDPSQKPVGMVTIEKLYAASPANTMSEIMRRDIKTVDPYVDQEEVVIAAITNNLDAIPVVDPEGRFVGAVDHDSILHILDLENVEDFLRLSGIHPEQPIIDIAKVRASDLVRLRIPWLILGLIGGMVATIVVNYFEGTLKQELTLAFFIPVIVYMSDAVGTQTETIFIRSLSLEAINVKRYMMRESIVGLAMALILSILIFIFASAFLQSIRVATIVGIAMFASILTAVFIAILIPWTFSRFKKDPAFGSGPFATIIQDILSIIIYFAVATLILFR